MALFINNDKTLQVNESDLGDGERRLIEKLWALVEEHGFDPNMVSTGMSPGPDIGYFELSDRYWRGALCIYISGLSKAYWEVGAGFSEPWLFNSRQAIELYIKGCIFYAEWYKELLIDPFKSGRKTQVGNLLNMHNIRSGFKTSRMCGQEGK